MSRRQAQKEALAFSRQNVHTLFGETKTAMAYAFSV